MASILKFVVRDVHGRRRSLEDTSGPCQIVIFPGVRYERWTEEEAPKPTPRPKRRRARRARPN